MQLCVLQCVLLGPLATALLLCHWHWRDGGGGSAALGRLMVMIIDWSPLAVVEVLLEATSSSKEAPANIGLSQPRKTASRDSEFATPLVTRLLFQRWIAAELLEGIVRSAVLRSKSLELQLRSLEESGAK